MNDRETELSSICLHSAPSAALHGDEMQQEEGRGGLPLPFLEGSSWAAAVGTATGLMAFSPLGPPLAVAGVESVQRRLLLATLVDMTDGPPRLDKGCLFCLLRVPGTSSFIIQLILPSFPDCRLLEGALARPTRGS